MGFYHDSFMNLCGSPIVRAMRFYKIPIERLVVIHDDVDLVLGKLKAKVGGGDGGHNGIKSIDAALGGEVGNNYARIRIGIARPPSKQRMNAHVLGKLTAVEAAALTPLLGRVAAELPTLLGGDIPGFLQAMVNEKSAEKSPEKSPGKYGDKASE